MRKYRIAEITLKSGIKFYRVQTKGFLFWHSLLKDDRYYCDTDTIEQAKDAIKWDIKTRESERLRIKLAKISSIKYIVLNKQS